MAIVRWHRNWPSVWPSIFDEGSLKEFSNWPDLSTSIGLNIYETDNDVIVEAPVPGIPEDKVDVTVEGNVLTICAEHEETEEEKKKKKTVYKETRQTSFNYSTSLPRMVEGSKASAEVDNGIVTVSIPKIEDEQPKKITVTKKAK